MNIEKIIAEAVENGFTRAAPLDISTMKPMQEVRDMCAVDKCHAYNKNWSCPPACGTVDECAAEIQTYTSGIIGAKAEFKGNLFFTTGYLYVTADMSTLKRTSLPKEELVVDLLVHEEKLYALSGRTLEDGTYRITVWENTTGKYASFKKVVTLTYQAPPLSFVYDGTTFYIGTGNVHADLEKNGMILVVPYEK